METITCNCERCGLPLRVAEPSNPKAELLRRSKEPKGVCLDCATTEWLMNNYPGNMLLDRNGPKVLLQPPFQQRFGQIMQAGNADAPLDEIDWERIVANWELPVYIDKKNPLNPYTPTHPKRAEKGGRSDAP